MAYAFTDAFIVQSIQKGMESAIRAIVDEEAKEASKRVESRVKSEADRLALKLLKHYSIDYNRSGELVIVVRKDIPEPQ